jgi:hypothetical protein
MKSISLSPARLLGLSLLFVLAIAGCQKENSSQPNDGLTTTLPTSVKVYLTDDQSLVFDKVFIDLQKLEIKIEDDGVDSVDGWFSLNITPGIYDILQFRNGLDTLFATGTIPANRKLQKIRLTLGNNNSVEKDGKTYPLIVKDKDNEVIAKLESSNVEFTSPDQFMFWIDFDAGRSIKKNNSGSGNNNGFELRSQIRIFTKSKSGRIEGRVLPAAANAIVMAINGTDTATAKPEREGEFKIVGLKAGTYQVFIDATSNNYKDTVLTNVVVRHNEDTKLGTIVLRQ